MTYGCSTFRVWTRHRGGWRSCALPPFQARQFRLHLASERDAEWLRTELDAVSRAYGPRVALDASGFLTLDPAG